MTAEQLLNQLILSAKSQEKATHEELIRLKERQEQLRQHRMELEGVADAMKAEADQ